MSTSTSLSRRLKFQLPENGYESPAPLDDDLQLENIGNIERRRNGFTNGNEEARDQLADIVLEGRMNGSAPRGEQLRSNEEKIPITAGFRDRVGCYTWTWFTMNMATGGIANMLHSSNDMPHTRRFQSNSVTVPYESDWLRIIGTIVFLFNIALFLMNCILLTLRFRWNPGSFRASFISQSEVLFIPACVSVTKSSLFVVQCLPIA